MGQREVIAALKDLGAFDKETAVTIKQLEKHEKIPTRISSRTINQLLKYGEIQHTLKVEKNAEDFRDMLKIHYYVAPKATKKISLHPLNSFGKCGMNTTRRFRRD